MGFLGITQDIGKISIWSDIIIGSILSILLIIVAIYFGFFYHKGWKKTSANILNSHCTKQSYTNSKGRKKNKYPCDVQIKYKNSNENEYTKNLELHGSSISSYPKGTTINVTYDPKDPTNVNEYVNKKAIVSIISIIIIVTLVGVFFSYTFRKNKTYQTLKGVGTEIDVVKRIFDGGSNRITISKDLFK